MIVHFITYSDERYKDRQNSLNILGEQEFDVVHSYNREWLINTDFYKENKEILDLGRGGGYWLWKPFIILETLKKIENNDIILYLDSGDVFYPGVKKFLIQYFQNNDSLLTTGAYYQKDYTKKDCFVRMDCDEPKYHNTIQLEAGIISFKKTERIMSSVSEWLKYACDKHIITDIENIHGENDDSFVDHRHDQSIITNLAIKNNLNANNFLRKYIECNVN